MNNNNVFKDVSRVAGNIRTPKNSPYPLEVISTFVKLFSLVGLISGGVLATAQFCYDLFGKKRR